MAATQKRWLTAPKSKLSRADLATVLRKEHAWSSLPQETRQNLYDLLPPPGRGEPAHDIDVHPLKCTYKKYIEVELRRWQDDLGDGREAKKWREDAMLAGRDRLEGKWEDLQASQREAYWGQAPRNATLKINGRHGSDQRVVPDSVETATVDAE